MQILKGTLSDFHRISLNDKQPIFEWEEILPGKNKDHPGPRAKQALIAYKDSIFSVGGIKSAI